MGCERFNGIHTNIEVASEGMRKYRMHTHDFNIKYGEEAHIDGHYIAVIKPLVPYHIPLRNSMNIVYRSYLSDAPEDWDDQVLITYAPQVQADGSNGVLKQFFSEAQGLYEIDYTGEYRLYGDDFDSKFWFLTKKGEGSELDSDNSEMNVDGLVVWHGNEFAYIPFVQQLKNVELVSVETTSGSLLLNLKNTFSGKEQIDSLEIWLDGNGTVPAWLPEVV